MDTSNQNKRHTPDAPHDAVSSPGAASTSPHDSNPTPAEAKTRKVGIRFNKKKGDWADKVDSDDAVSVNEDDLGIDKAIPDPGAAVDDEVPQLEASPQASPKQSPHQSRHTSPGSSVKSSPRGRQPHTRGRDNERRSTSPRRAQHPMPQTR